MPNTLHALMQGVDGFEVVRDQVAVLLAENSSAQVALASGEPDPELWRFRVYTERSRPWESFRDQQSPFPTSPIVNVWYQGDSFPGDKGDTVERQAAESTINVDCYGLGQAADDPGGGHTPGDLDAVLEAQRCVRFVRRILMAAQNMQLQLGPNQSPDAAVWQRWVSGRQMFQPDLDGSTLDVIAFRVTLDVTFNEHSPQLDHTNLLEFVAADIQRASDGAVLGGAHFDYT